MKNLLMAVLLMFCIIGCENQKTNDPGTVDVPRDTVPSPPPVIDPPVKDSDTLDPPPPPAEKDTVLPPPPPPVDDHPGVPVPPPDPGNNYTLIPQDYGIIQGTVTDAQALANRYALEKAFQDAVNQKIDTFKIGAAHIFFDVTTITSKTNPNFYAWVEGINIPGNFNLQMSDDTYLHVQPNNSREYALFSLLYSDNVHISGGNLVGERMEHTWSGSGSDEWGHLLQIKSSQHVTVEKTKFSYANGDGITVSARRFSFADDYIPSKHILLKDLDISYCRRQGISVTDTQGTIIDGIKFDHIGTQVGNSKGADPRYAIDIEPYREWGKDKQGNPMVHHYERVSNVEIRNCIETNGGVGAFIFKAGDSILVENNTIESGMTFDHVTNAVTRNNKVINPHGGRVGIAVGSTSQFSGNISALDNYVEGCDQGIRVSGTNTIVDGNTIVNAKNAIVVKDVTSGKIINNSASDGQPSGYGLYCHVTYAGDLLVEGNSISSDRPSLVFTVCNWYDGQENNRVIVKDNDFFSNQQITIARTKNVDLVGNRFNSGLRVQNADNINFRGNEINAGKKHGIDVLENVGSIAIVENTIKSFWKCTNIGSDPEQLVEHSNECN